MHKTHEQLAREARIRLQKQIERELKKNLK
jgi:hypothetical protein